MTVNGMQRAAHTINDLLEHEFSTILRRRLEQLEKDLLAVARLVKRCEGCGLHFVDRTKNNTRRWCDMRRCGNRSKVAALRRRRQQSKLG